MQHKKRIIISMILIITTFLITFMTICAFEYIKSKSAISYDGYARYEIINDENIPFELQLTMSKNQKIENIEYVELLINKGYITKINTHLLTDNSDLIFADNEIIGYASKNIVKNIDLELLDNIEISSDSVDIIFLFITDVILIILIIIFFYIVFCN